MAKDKTEVENKGGDVKETPAQTTDRRSETSAENGRKGGRPVTEATKRALAARQYISAEVEKSLSPIVAKAINDAILGDRHAREWLSAYAWGKPAINMGVDENGQPLVVVFDNAFASGTETDSE